MNWRDRLSLLLGTTTAASLLGLPAETFAAPTEPRSPEHPSSGDAFVYATIPGTDLHFVAHSSHSSHASHASHSSGSGGGYATPFYYPPSPPPPYRPPPLPPPPALRPSPPAPAAPLYSPTAPSPSTTPPVAAGVISFVQQIQLALIARGYDPGPADGHLGPKTVGALSAFQEANGLTASGYVDAATVAALGVAMH